MALISAPTRRTLVLGTRTYVHATGWPTGLTLGHGEWVYADIARRRRAIGPDPAQLPAAQGRLPRDLGARRPRGAGALHRGPLRPGHPRPDAAAPRRRRGLPAAAPPQPGADHHADRQRQRDRQGRRPRGGRRRLHHQAFLDARVPQPRQGGAAALADGPRPAGGGADRAGRAARRPSPAPGHPARRGGRRDLRRVRDPHRPGPLARPRAQPRDPARARLGGSDYRDPRTVDVHIRHLREKMESDPKQPEYLLTVRGVGYRFRE